VTTQSDDSDYDLSPEERKLTDLIVEASQNGFSAMELEAFKESLGEVTAEEHTKLCTQYLQGWLRDHPERPPQLPDSAGFPV